MSNYIISFDLSDANDKIRLDFDQAMLSLGWTLWDRRSSDNEICRLPNTTMLIKGKTDEQVKQTVEDASRKAELQKHGVSISKFVISEYRRVWFESDDLLSRKQGKSTDMLKQLIEQELLD